MNLATFLVKIHTLKNIRDRSFGLEFYNTILCGTVIPLFRRKSSAEYFELKGWFCRNYLGSTTCPTNSSIDTSSISESLISPSMLG